MDVQRRFVYIILLLVTQKWRWSGINGLNKIRLGYLADEIADCIQACVNLAARYGIDLSDAMGRCWERNRERGRC